MQDFAGSTAVHLIGATGGLAALLLLGRAQGQVRGRRQAAGDPRATTCRCSASASAILLTRLVRVQPGLDAERARRALRGGRARDAARGRGRRARLGARRRASQDRHDRHRHGRQRHDRRARRDHGAVGLRGPVGRRRHRPRRRRDRPARRLRDRQAARRPGRRAHGARPLRCVGHALMRPLHAAARSRSSTPSATGGLVLHGLVRPAGRPGARRGVVFACVFVDELRAPSG